METIPSYCTIDLTSFRTVDIIELPNAGGNHASPFYKENTEYVVGNLILNFLLMERLSNAET
ncbi:MAG: hypothetical protein IPH84_17930 [Bacteroidales bacterium]|nr:hypothetical protein [Bacteroidales bacterium]